MKRITRTAFAAAALALAGLVLFGPATGQGPVQGANPLAALQPEKKFQDFATAIKGAKKHEGLLNLYHRGDDLLAEIPRTLMEKPLLCPIAIARGMGMGGYTLNFDEQWVLMFKRVNDKVYLIRRDVHHRARPGSPVAKAVETTYTDSVLRALRIISINPMQQSLLVSLNEILMNDFANLGLGFLDPSRSTWHKVKAFPKNIEIQVAATFSGMRGRSQSVVDARGNTVIIQYGLVELPGFGFQPRLADDRVGHFLSAAKDYSSDRGDSSFVRYVNRWRLERADGNPSDLTKLSPPKKKIVYWIEKSVPDEYRAYVREGILEWNKAFEKIGFRDAIEVRQQEDEDFDPEDINYNTFRWITTDAGFAMGPSRVNPLTGEIIDADIIFDADMIRFWRHEYKQLGGGKPAQESPSYIRSFRRGETLYDPLTALREGSSQSWSRQPQRQAEDAHQRHLWAVRQGVCQCGAAMKYELGLAAMAMVARGQGKTGGKVPEELIGQAVKYVVMHEVGHTLGLRHNFKASTMLDNKDLNNTKITRAKGLVGSVMDYSPVNLAPKGTKQGDYFTTTLGPYDYWAIEYAYKPLPGGTEGEVAKLKEIASKVAQPDLTYATDEDMYGTSDPLVHAFDLGSDPMKFAQDRMLLAEELMKDLAERLVEKGEGYQRARRGFQMLLQQYGNGAFLIAAYVGGVHYHRDHRGDPSARDTMVPARAAKQRAALKFLQDHILTDKTFQFPPKLLRHLAAERWYHWGAESSFFSSVEFPLHERVLAIQRVVLSHMLAPDVLRRIQNNALKTDKEEQPLTLAEVFRSLTDGVWSDLPNGKEGKKALATSVIRRNLQREHLKDLTNLVLGGKGSSDNLSILLGVSQASPPPDARSLARMHLRAIRLRIDGALKAKDLSVDETTRAHLEECSERIEKVLGANMVVNQP
jgi:hypothetical protein